MKLLMHICCSNCAIYPVKILREAGHIVMGLWFNPNIHPHQEYELRLDSLKYLAHRWSMDMLYSEYNPLDFFKMFNPSTKSLSNGNFENIIDFIPPSPERCKLCYRMRLENTAQEAIKHGFNAFSTTLLISPYQDFESISTMGSQLADKYNVLFYLKDFRPYFREAMAASREFGFYRQKYCGCIYSKEERFKNKIKD